MWRILYMDNLPTNGNANVVEKVQTSNSDVKKTLEGTQKMVVLGSKKFGIPMIHLPLS